jgi:hypothetical protein
VLPSCWVLSILITAPRFLHVSSISIFPPWLIISTILELCQSKYLKSGKKVTIYLGLTN